MRSAPVTAASERPLQFRTREQLVYEHLRHAITHGQWGPDEPIVASRVAEELGVSRITIANALKRLAAEGFVRLDPHREATVARMDAAEIEEIYVMRVALESEASSFAAERVQSAQLAELRRLNDGIAHLQGAPASDIRAADRAFHEHLWQAARMPRLAATLHNLADQCEYYRARLLDTSGLAVPSSQGHGPLLHALAAHDREAARVLTREHVRRGMQSVLEALERSGGR